MESMEWIAFVGVTISLLTLVWLVWKAIQKDIEKSIKSVKEETEKSIDSLDKRTTEMITLLREESKERKKELKDDFQGFKNHISTDYMKKEVCEGKEKLFSTGIMTMTKEVEKTSKHIEDIYGEIKKLSVNYESLKNGNGVKG